MQGSIVDHFIIFCYIDSIAPSTTKLMIELSDCIDSTIQDGRNCEYPYPYFMNIFSTQVFLWVGLLLTYYVSSSPTQINIPLFWIIQINLVFAIMSERCVQYFLTLHELEITGA